MDLIGINRTDLNTIVDKLSEYEKGLLDKFVTKLEAQKMGKKMMVCHLTCANGFEVMGEAGCEDPAKFVFLLGYEYKIGRAHV